MKIAVIEDSGLARQGLVNMLAVYPDLELVCSAGHPDDALEELVKTPADVLFLDIHMPGKSGFDLLASLNYAPQIIFTTAYPEYAIRSFDFNTVDYLLKPISRERLAQAIDKLRQQFAAAGTSEEAELIRAKEQPFELSSKLFIKDRDVCHLVEVRNIRYFESCKNDARIFFSDKKAFIKRSLNQIEARLPQNYFFRANRQYIVNLQAVEAVEEAVNKSFTLIMDDGMEIEISRRRAGLLMEKLSF